MDVKWTPGPWVVDPLGLGAIGDISTPDGMQCVAQSQQVVGDFRNEVRTANAHLIAAAPDMAPLVELLASLPITDRADDVPVFGFDDVYITHGHVRAARAALRKARGE